MRIGLMRRSLAAASATVMAGAVLVVGGAGVASAAPVSAQGQTSGNVLGNFMSYTRTVSNGTPVYGETVTITNKLERRGGSNSNLVYWIKDLHDDCLDYVDGSARWTVSGNTYRQGDKPNEVLVSGTELEINPPALNSWAPPVEMSAEFVVNCNAGPVPNGGIDWSGTTMNGTSASRTVGPAITVLRKPTTVFLNVPVNPQVGQSVTLKADTTGVPEGQSVTFTVDGSPVGTGVVNSGSASLTWPTTSAGVKQVQASFGQTDTHGGSQSQIRPVTVSTVNVDSTTILDIPGTPTVGQATNLIATVDPAGEGGTVTFKENGTLIDSAAVGADGKATVSWIPSTQGDRSIDASFSGRPGVNASTIGKPVTVQAPAVNAIATRTTVDQVPVTAANQPVTLIARVDPSEAGGTVTFYDGTTTIGTAPVGAGGVATITTWAPAAGERTVVAIYSGQGVYLASQGSTAVVITPAAVIPGPDPVVPDPTDPAFGSLGSLTGSLGGGAAGASSPSPLGS